MGCGNYFLITQVQELINNLEGLFRCFYPIINTWQQVRVHVGQEGSGEAVLAKKKGEHAMCGKFYSPNFFSSGLHGNNHSRMFFLNWAMR